MKIVFLGSGSFGIPILDAVYATPHNLLGVVTAPDKPQGRGRVIKKSAVKVWAEAHRIPVLPIERVNSAEAIQTLEELHPDFFLVVSYGTILNEKVLSIPKICSVNVHPSLLPKYRGATPIQQALLNGDSVTGISLFRMDPKIDTGDILAQEQYELHGDENAKDMFDLLASRSAELTVETLHHIEKDTIIPIAQNDHEATLCRKLTKEDGWVDWQRDARSIHNQVRGLFLWPGTQTKWKGKIVKILKTRMANEDKHFKELAGKILHILDPLGIEVATGHGSLWVQELRMEGKNTMTYREFVNGFHVNIGDIFGQ